MRGAPATNSGASMRSSEHGGVAAQVVDDLQAHLEDAQQEAACEPAARQVELGLALERVEHAV